MDTSSTSLRTQVKRLHSLNRQKEYIAPSKRDVLCPYFQEETFIKTGTAAVTDTFCAVCEDVDNTLACDYKESRMDLQLCKRYWADPIFDLNLTNKIPTVDPAIWQEGQVEFDYERKFEDRTAKVTLSITKYVPKPVYMGDFIRDWSEIHLSDTGSWSQVWNSSNNRDEILNTKNQNGISFWYNPAHLPIQNYKFDFFVQARGGDDDTLGAVFRYSDAGYYTVEWDSGGMGHNGMSLYRYVTTDSGYTKTRIGNHPAKWGANSSYIHNITISVMDNKITVIAYRMSGATKVKVAEIYALDLNVPSLLNGAFGPLTESQPNTYFWDFNVREIVKVPVSSHSLATQDIPLKYVQEQGSIHIVSEPMSKYFPASLADDIVKANGLEPEDIESLEYEIISTNVAEGVIFSGTNFIATMTTDSNNRIAMRTFNYDAAILPFKGYLTAPTRGLDYHITDMSNLDKQLVRVKFHPIFKRYFDQAQLKVNGLPVYFFVSINGAELVVDFIIPIQLEAGDIITLEYNSNTFQLEYYEGGYVDTHDKIFKIEGNKLYWHHIPSYEGE